MLANLLHCIEYRNEFYYIPSSNIVTRPIMFRNRMNSPFEGAEKCTHVLALALIIQIFPAHMAEDHTTVRS
jgi:hypothetical protein